MSAVPTEDRVPERQRLETAFARARWLAVIALAAGAPLSGMHVAAAVALAAAYALGNVAAWYANARVRTLAAQRRLGIGAVTLDAAVALGGALAAPADAAVAFYGALVLVAAEAGVRYAPPKDLAASAVLVAALGVVMGVRGGLRDDPFRALPFALWSALIMGAGFVIGSAVREVYRHAAVRPAAMPADAGSAGAPPRGEPTTPPLTDELPAVLTPRERQVLTLIAQGYSNPRIAEALVIEQKTVKNHINNMYAKLNVHNRYEAITQTLAQRREPPHTQARGEDAHAQGRV